MELQEKVEAYTSLVREAQQKQNKLNDLWEMHGLNVLKSEIAEVEAKADALKSEIAKAMYDSDLEEFKVNNVEIKRRSTLNTIKVDETRVIAWIKKQKNLTNKTFIQIKEKLDVNGFKKFAKVKLAEGDISIDGIDVVDTHTLVTKIL